MSPERPRPRRALWISDYFPRPQEMTTGTWALESAVALQAAGLPVVVMAPTPWIPGALARTDALRGWAQVPAWQELSGVPVYYPRVPHYPRRWVVERVYNRIPALEAGWLWPWFRRAADEVMRRHPFDVVHANFLFPSGYLALRLKERYGTPFVAHERSVQRLAAACQHAARGSEYRQILRAADAVVTENEQMAGHLRALEPAIRRLVVLKQPGSHPEQIGRLRRPKPADLAGRSVVLSVGALSERKGHAYLVRAIAALQSEFPGVTCHIVGEGPERPALRALIEELGLSTAVKLVGRRPHAEVLGAMSWCDIFALPSWGEAGGTVYGEAMQFGTPIIACTGEGIGELVQNGVQGLLVPSRDSAALAGALRRLLADGAARKEMGCRAAELTTAELGYPKLAHTLIGLYAELPMTSPAPAANRFVALRHWQSRLLQTLGSAALVVGIFWFVPFSEVVQSLQGLKLGYVFAAMAATIAVAYVQSMQLWLLLRSVKIPISTWEVFETNMITRFYGQFLPSELMGAAIKLYRLAGPRKQWGEVMAAQVCFRLINALVLVVLGFGFWLMERPSGPGAVVGPLLAMTSASLIALHIFLSRDTPARLARRLVPARLLAWSESGARVRNARDVLRTTAASYRLFGNVITPITAIAFFRHLLGMASFALYAEAVGVNLTYLAIGWIRVVLQAVMMLPVTVSGLGVREGSLVLLLQGYSVPPSQAVALSLVLFGSGVLCNGLGGAFELVTLLRSGRWGIAPNPDQTRHR